MKLKLASAMSAGVLDALEDLIKPLYTKPGMRIVGITEIAHIERTEIAPNEDKEPVVTIGIKMLEIAHGDQVEPLRKAALALKVQRTAEGTLDEDVERDTSGQKVNLGSSKDCGASAQEPRAIKR